MITCGVCGETANPGSIFCRRCGAELPRRGASVSDAQTTVLPVVPTGPAAGPPEPPHQEAPPYEETPYQQPPAQYQQPQYQQPQYQQPQYQQPEYQQPPAQYQQPPAQYEPDPHPLYREPAPRPAYLPPEPPPSYAGSGRDEAPVFLPPDERPPSGSRNRNRTVFAIIGGVVVLVLVVFGIAIALLSKDSSKSGVAQPAPPTTRTSGPSISVSASPTAPKTSPKPKPTPTVNKLKIAQTAALKQLGGLVANSGSARAGIGAALSQINSCESIPQAVNTLKNAARTRQTLAEQASKLNLGSIPTGSQLIASFRSSMQASALADDNYATWGAHVQGCKKSPPSKPALKVAQTWDSQATTAKTSFADQYNAVAGTLGLPGTSAGSF